MSYQRYSSLEQHLQCGKHKRSLEHETLLDRAMLRYAENLDQGGANIEELSDATYQTEEQYCNVEISPVHKGWCLKKDSKKGEYDSIQVKRVTS